MYWLKNHGDTIATLAVFAGCFWHLNGKMSDRLSAIEKDVAIIKTVLIMKNIMPNELAVKEEKK